MFPMYLIVLLRVYSYITVARYEYQTYYLFLSMTYIVVLYEVLIL